jgi:hypothetical protein
LQNLDKSIRKEMFFNYLEEKPYYSLYFLRFFFWNEQKICSNIEFPFAFNVQNVSEKLLYTLFSVVADFFQIFRLL